MNGIINVPGLIMASSVEFNNGKTLQEMLDSGVLPDGTDIVSANTRVLLAPIFPSRFGYPNLDTVKRTFTILNASTIYYGTTQYLLQEDLTVSLPDNSTAHKIVFDTTKKTLVRLDYNSAISKSQVVVALITISSRSYSAKYEQVSITCPYAVDGVLFGIEIPKPTLPSYNVKSVNHRGYNAVAPENTLPAFRLSKEYGFDWIETDVQFTSDNVPVILHDGTINRTARQKSGEELADTVSIGEITYEQALGYDFGIWKSPEYAGTKIPTFEQCVALCRNIGLRIRIELKSETVTTGKIAQLIDVVEKYGMKGNVEFVSFSIPLIKYINSNHPDYAIGVIKAEIDDALLSDIDEILATRDDLTCAVSIGSAANTPEKYALLAEKGVVIDVYTITNTSQILDADPHVQSFTTNRYNAGAELYQHDMAN